MNFVVSFLVKSQKVLNFGVSFGVSLKGIDFNQIFTYWVKILDCCPNFRAHIFNGL